MPTVVVADADRDTRELYQAYLAAQGWNVVTATTGDQAAHLCERRRVDILLTEVALPGVDGIALCRRIRATPGGETLPILVLTAVSHPHYLVRARVVGADRILVKPVPPDLVHAELTRMVERWPAVLDRASFLRRAAAEFAATVASRRFGDERPSSGCELHAAATPDGVAIGALLTDRAGFCIGSNPTAADLIGCSRSELMTRAVWESLPPQGRAEGRALWRSFLDAGELGGAVTIATRAGERRDLQYAAFANVLRGTHLSVFAPDALYTTAAERLSRAAG